MSENKFKYLLSTGHIAHLEPQKVHNGAQGACGLKLMRYSFSNTLRKGYVECPTCLCDIRMREEREERERLHIPDPERKRPHSNLTSDEVREIRRKYATRECLQVDLAERYGVSTTTIWNILHKRTWGDVV